MQYKFIYKNKNKNISKRLSLEVEWLNEFSLQSADAGDPLAAGENLFFKIQMVGDPILFLPLLLCAFAVKFI